MPTRPVHVQAEFDQNLALVFEFDERIRRTADRYYANSGGDVNETAATLMRETIIAALLNPQKVGAMLAVELARGAQERARHQGGT
jgi:hypothetical protein